MTFETAFRVPAVACSVTILGFILVSGLSCAGGDGDGDGDGDTDDELCDGCCFDPASDCRASEVCRWKDADLNDDEAPGACVEADGLAYILQIADVKICERTANGDEWDVGAGAPDPFLSIVVNGEETLSSPVEQDTFNAFTIAVAGELVLSSTDSVTIDVYDSDLTVNDYVGGVCLGSTCDGAIGIDPLRGIDGVIDIGCSSNGLSSMRVTLSPKTN